MEVQTAVRLINSELKFMPGWHWDAEDFTKRHEGCVKVFIGLDTVQSEREDAESSYPRKVLARGWFVLPVADVHSDAELYWRMLQMFGDVFFHEAREFVRIGETYWAPFHPHRLDGIRRWARKSPKWAKKFDLLKDNGDLQYGIA